MDKIKCTMLVDDDATTNFLNEMLFEDLDITQKLLVAHNGQEAIELIRQHCLDGGCPQLILLDVNMPVMNGFEFLKAYEELEFAHKQSVVIVMLTTSLNPSDIAQAQGAGVDGYIRKPLTEESLKELLNQHFALGL